MEALKLILLLFLVICAIAAAASRSLLVSVIIFMTYGLAMSVIWVILRAPDLAITEAAVGVCISSSLFFVTLKKINLIRKSREEGETDVGEEE